MLGAPRGCGGTWCPRRILLPAQASLNSGSAPVHKAAGATSAGVRFFTAFCAFDTRGPRPGLGCGRLAGSGFPTLGVAELTLLLGFTFAASGEEQM